MIRLDTARSDGRALPAPTPPPWSLFRLLPARVGSLPAELVRHLGPAVDAGRVRIVLSDDGSAVATRRPGR